MTAAHRFAGPHGPHCTNGTMLYVVMRIWCALARVKASTHCRKPARGAAWASARSCANRRGVAEHGADLRRPRPALRMGWRGEGRWDACDNACERRRVHGELAAVSGSGPIRGMVPVRRNHHVSSPRGGCGSAKPSSDIARARAVKKGVRSVRPTCACGSVA